jgi:hypothetical protein
MRFVTKSLESPQASIMQQQQHIVISAAAAAAKAAALLLHRWLGIIRQQTHNAYSLVLLINAPR